MYSLGPRSPGRQRPGFCCFPGPGVTPAGQREKWAGTWGAAERSTAGDEILSAVLIELIGPGVSASSVVSFGNGGWGVVVVMTCNKLHLLNKVPPHPHSLCCRTKHLTELNWTVCRLSILLKVAC